MNRNISLILLAILASIAITILLNTNFFEGLIKQWANFFNQFSIYQQLIIAIFVGYGIQVWLRKVGISHQSRLYTPHYSFLPLHIVITSIVIIFIIFNYQLAHLFFDKQSLPSWGLIIGMFMYIVKNSPIFVTHIEKNQEKLLFNRDLYVHRILKNIESDNASSQIALCGEYGAGKTSILNQIQSDLKIKGWLIVKIDSWGIDSSTIGQYILQETVNELTSRFDVSSFRTLPLDYQQALKSSNSWLYAFYKSITGQPNSITDQLTKLDSILKVTNTKLLIRIEDIDRNPNSAEYCNSLAVILDKLKSLNNLNFIIATGYTKHTSEILRKVCEYREDLVSENFIDYIDVLLLKWVNRAKREGHVLPSVYSEDKLSLNNFSNSFNGRADSLSESINRLISNPRVLKHVERSVDEIWIKGALLGEVDLIDLLIITLLKENYPEIFELVAKYKFELQNGINQIIPNVEVLKTEKDKVADHFKESITSSHDFRNISNCLSYVFPYWGFIINEKQNGSSSTGRQKISDNVTQVDYFNRIARKQIEVHEATEQEFLMCFNHFTNEAKNSKIVDNEMFSRIIDDRKWMELFNRFSGSFWSNSRYITKPDALKLFYLGILNHYKCKYDDGYTFESDQYDTIFDLFLSRLLTFSQSTQTPQLKRNGLLLLIVRKLLKYDIKFAVRILKIVDSRLKENLSKYLMRSLIRAIDSQNIFKEQNFDSITLITKMDNQMLYQQAHSEIGCLSLKF
jgi:hypothetical protein